MQRNYRKGENSVMFGTADGGMEFYKSPTPLSGGRKNRSMAAPNKGMAKGPIKGMRAPGPNVVKNNPFSGGGTYRNK